MQGWREEKAAGVDTLSVSQTCEMPDSCVVVVLALSVTGEYLLSYGCPLPYYRDIGITFNHPQKY